MFVYIFLYLLPLTVILMCTLQMYAVQPLVEVLFLGVQEFNFLVYSEPDGIIFVVTPCMLLNYSIIIPTTAHI